ncbi:MAG: hypothetical protein RXQ75_05385 [Acidianus hospitalis]
MWKKKFSLFFHVQVVEVTKEEDEDLSPYDALHYVISRRYSNSQCGSRLQRKDKPLFFLFIKIKRRAKSKIYRIINISNSSLLKNYRPRKTPYYVNIHRKNEKLALNLVTVQEYTCTNPPGKNTPEGACDYNGEVSTPEPITLGSLLLTGEAESGVSSPAPNSG